MSTKRKAYVLYSLFGQIAPKIYQTKATVQRYIKKDKKLSFYEFSSQDDAKQYILKSQQGQVQDLIKSSFKNLKSNQEIKEESSEMKEKIGGKKFSDINRVEKRIKTSKGHDVQIFQTAKVTKESKKRNKTKKVKEKTKINKDISIEQKKPIKADTIQDKISVFTKIDEKSEQKQKDQELINEKRIDNHSELSMQKKETMEEPQQNKMKEDTKALGDQNISEHLEKPSTKLYPNLDISQCHQTTLRIVARTMIKALEIIASSYQRKKSVSLSRK